MPFNIKEFRVLNLRVWHPQEEPVTPGLASLKDSLATMSFMPETCTRQIHLFSKVKKPEQFQRAFARLKDITQTCELLQGPAAYRFLLAWMVGYDPNRPHYFNSKRSGDDRFVLGKVREAWRKFAEKKGGEDQQALTLYAPYMQSLFEDARQIRMLIEEQHVQRFVEQTMAQQLCGVDGDSLPQQAQPAAQRRGQLVASRIEQLTPQLVARLLERVYDNVLYSRIHDLPVDYLAALRMPAEEYQQRAVRAGAHEHEKRLASLSNKLTALRSSKQAGAAGDGGETAVGGAVAAGGGATASGGATTNQTKTEIAKFTILYEQQQKNQREFFQRNFNNYVANSSAGRKSIRQP